MLKQSMFQVLDIGKHCIRVHIRVFWHIACWIKKMFVRDIELFTVLSVLYCPMANIKKSE